MAKKYSMTSLILLLFLFALTKSIDFEIIEYSSLTDSASAKGNTTKSFKVEFKDITRLLYYMKIEVVSNDDSPAPLLCFSTSDSNCTSRKQLVKNSNGKNAIMWLKREEFTKEDESLYIYVQCEKETCSYDLTLKGNEYATFGPNFVYSYLVNDQNKAMDFIIVGTETNAFMTVALDGSQSATLTVENADSEVFNYRTAKALTFPLKDMANESIMASIKVRANIGEYLTLSVHLIIDDVFALEKILPNSPEITGYLEKGLISCECFPIDLSDSKYNSIDQFYITGRIHTKYASIYLLDEYGDYIEDSDMDIIDGQINYVLTNNKKLNYFCFELPYYLNTIVMAFSFSVTQPNSLSKIYKYYPPQITGEIYRRMIPKGSVVFFSGTKADDSAKKYDYSLYQRKGFTKMYIGNCTTYPDCNYDVNELDNLISVKSINRMAIWTTDIDKSSAIANEKYVIVAYCEDDGNDKGNYCEFETSIFSKSQDIYLVEGEKFSKKVISQEKGEFIIDLKLGRKIQTLIVDIMLFSGDVNFESYQSYDTNLNEEIQIDYKKYYLSNKILFIFHFDQLYNTETRIMYSANSNSFFNIQYNISSSLNQIEELVSSGESYLVQIAPSQEYKYVYLLNQFYKNKNSYLAKFFQLNCEFEVNRGDISMDFFDGYSQEIIDESTEGYSSDYYTYLVKIKNVDSSNININNKMCMMYIEGYEAETKNEREIVVAENLNQQIIFKENFQKIRFLYPDSGGNKDLAVHINVIDKAIYKINIFVKDNLIKEESISNTQIFYLEGKIISGICDKENNVCPIIVEAIYEKKIIKESPMLDISIRPIQNMPSYLKKDIAKLDFVSANKPYYLYTDIGKGDVGEIIVNFFRELGVIYGKVVRKDQTSVDEEANWRGKYRMPSKEWEDSLLYDGYTKKLIIDLGETNDCIEGCYFLIAIELSQSDKNISDYKFFPFSILTKITSNSLSYTSPSIIGIHIDDIIIGDVEVSTNGLINEFFAVRLLHDSDIVEIDWQSSLAGLYINIGKEMINAKNADFVLLPLGRETIFSLDKFSIINRALDKRIKIPHENSLEDIVLYIGILTDKVDSIDTELYSFRIHQPVPNTGSIDIIEVNTDQKIMCNPTIIDSGREYRCLFLVKYDDDDTSIASPLLAYAASLNQSSINYMYANFIDKDIYDQNLQDELAKSIPTDKTADFNSKADCVEYIYTSSLKKGKYILISVISDKEEPIMILTFMPTYNYSTFEFIPNPFGGQLLSFSEKQLNLSFPFPNGIMVDIVALNGQAEIKWKKSPEKTFILKGEQDRISLSSKQYYDQLIIQRLNYDNDNNNLAKMENPGFVFYIKYHKKYEYINFDQVDLGKSVEVSYRDTDLPLYLFSKIGICFYGVNVAITFKDLFINKKGKYYSSPISIMALIAKESTIYTIINNDDLKPNSNELIGIYDPAINTAQTFLPLSFINENKYKFEDIPTLYLSVKKTSSFPAQENNNFSINAQISLTFIYFVK